MAQRKLVEDLDARFLRALIWSIKCQGEYASGKVDRLPRNKDGTTYVPPLLDRSDFHPISIITNEERKEWRAKKEELKRGGLPHSPDKIREALEEEKANKRARGEIVPGMAIVSFTQASVMAKEHDKYGKNIPAAAPRVRAKKARDQRDESPAPNPAKSARVQTAMPALTTAIAKAGELQRRQHDEATRRSEVRLVLRSVSREERWGSGPYIPSSRKREIP